MYESSHTTPTLPMYICLMQIILYSFNVADENMNKWIIREIWKCKESFTNPVGELRPLNQCKIVPAKSLDDLV